MHNYLFLFFITFWALGCQNKTESTAEKGSAQTMAYNPESLLMQQLIGTWVTTYMTVEINSQDPSEKKQPLEAGIEDFEEILNMKANSSTFLDDGTFLNVYVGKDDLDRHESSGQWSIMGDSLQMYYLSPAQRIQKYHVKLQGPVGIFTGYVDWDQDGKKDDRVTERSDKVIRSF